VTGWERVKAGAPLVTVLGIAFAGAVITSAVSYEHEYHLAHGNGQAPWVSSVLPFTVDGMVFVAGVALLWVAANRVRGWKHLWQPRGVLAVGMLATIAANLYSDLHFWWLGPAVAASSGVSLVLMSAVAFWLLAEQRKVAAGDTGHQVLACSCPPPPVTLAEALPLARGRLQDEGELSGEEALAGRFGVTRHAVRAALADERSRGGSRTGPPNTVPAAHVPAGVAPATPQAPAGALPASNGQVKVTRG
jgi:hypothetical protein